MEEQYKYNDYVEAVKQYLQQYNDFKTYIENVKADIEDIKAQLRLEAAPKTTKFTGMPGGGDSSQQEMSLQRAEFLNKELDRLNRELIRLEPLVKRIDRSLNRLDKNDEMLMNSKWICNCSWESTAEIVSASVGYCRNQNERVLKKLARMIFGPRADSKQAIVLFR